MASGKSTEDYNLMIDNPKLAEEWHPTKNGLLRPEDYKPHSNKSVWWKCSVCGYDYPALITNRNKKKGTGCPKCAGKVVIEGENDLATLRPHLAKEWHPTKNGGLKPSDIAVNSHTKVWWTCQFGHEWPATIASRANGRGCKECSKIGTSFPEQAIFYYIKKEYPDSLNTFTEFGFELDIYIPSILTAIEYDGIWTHKNNNRFIRDNKKDKKCLEKNIRLIRIRENGLKRTLFAECLERKDNGSIQSLQEVIIELFTLLGHQDCTQINIERDYLIILHQYYEYIKENNLRSLYPSIAEEWHPTENGTLTPDMVTAKSSIKVKWICPRGHTYPMEIGKRTTGRSCPICSNQLIVSGINDLQTRNPVLAKEWSPNNKKKASEVAPFSHTKYLWICSKGHEYPASPANRSKGRGCPICANIVIISGINDLATMRPDLIKEWDFKKNTIDPTTVAPNTEQEVHWICPKGHEYISPISKRNSGKRGCPYCSHHRIIPGNDLESLYPILMKQWDYEKNSLMGLDPSKLSPKSNEKPFWKCPLCGHQWPAYIYNRTKPNCTGKCPVCKQ